MLEEESNIQAIIKRLLNAITVLISILLIYDFSIVEDNQSVMWVVKACFVAYISVFGINYVLLGTKSIWHTESKSDEKYKITLGMVITFGGVMFGNAYIAKVNYIAKQARLDKQYAWCDHQVIKGE